MLAVTLLASLTACADVTAYYDGLDASSSLVARATWHARIRGHTRVPCTSTTQLDVWSVLEITDEDPMDPNRVVDVYRNASLLKSERSYQREHSWPSSYGFPNNVVSNRPYADIHHLHLADGSYNASRGNLPYDWCTSACDERPTVATNGTGGGTGTYPGNSNWRAVDRWEVWRERRGTSPEGCSTWMSVTRAARTQSLERPSLISS